MSSPSHLQRMALQRLMMADIRNGVQIDAEKYAKLMPGIPFDKLQIRCELTEEYLRSKVVCTSDLIRMTISHLCFSVYRSVWMARNRQLHPSRRPKKEMMTMTKDPKHLQSQNQLHPEEHLRGEQRRSERFLSLPPLPPRSTSHPRYPQ